MRALTAIKKDGIEIGREEGIEMRDFEIVSTLLMRRYSDLDILDLLKINAEKLAHYKALLNV